MSRTVLIAVALACLCLVTSANDIDSVSDSELMSLERVFGDYRIGYNNRALFGRAIRHLELLYNQKVEYAFGKRNCVTTSPSSGVTTLYIDEQYFDHIFEMVRFFESIWPRQVGPERTPLPVSEHLEAVGRFILAHEYFHVRLQHLATDRGRKVEGVRTSLTGAPLSRALEAQADWFASIYVQQELYLPIVWPAEIVGTISVNEKGEFIQLDETNQSEGYLPHWERKILVKNARREHPPTVAFHQPELDCRQQLVLTDAAVWLLPLLRELLLPDGAETNAPKP